VTSGLLGQGFDNGKQGQGGQADGEELQSEDKPADLLALHMDNLSVALAKLSKPGEKRLKELQSAPTVKRASLLQEIDWSVLDDWTAVDVIGLGRVLLRLADLGDPPSQQFLARLRDEAPEISEFVRESLYFGALGALYYTDDLTVRAPSATVMAPVLLDLVTMPEVGHATAAIGDALSGTGLFYTPGSGKQSLILEIVTQPAADNKSKSDLLAIKLGDVDLITTLQIEEDHRFSKLLQLPDGAFDSAVGPLIEIISRYHRLPRQLLAANIDIDQHVRVSEFCGVELEAVSEGE
jgi:hypothetical protein